MRLAEVCAIAAAAAFTLAGCGLDSGRGGSPIPLAETETVGDAAALVAHRPTDSQNTAAAIDAIGALGSRLNALAREGDGDLAPTAGSACREGVKFVAAYRGRRGLTETQQFYDAGCTQLARDAIQTVTSRGPTSKTVERRVLLYAPGRSVPLGLRRESTTIANARFGAGGAPAVRHGYSQATSSVLWIGNHKEAVAESEIAIVPGDARASGFCQASAGYSAAGFPALDATFGWESDTLGSSLSATRVAEEPGVVVFSTTQSGGSFIGPIGSLSIQARRRNGGCLPTSSPLRIAGGTPAGLVTIPIRATYHNGLLWALSVNGASLAGGYRFTANTVRTGMETPSVTGVLVNGGVRVADLATDTFGDGTLTITSSGAQYRLVDWTILR
ncbi:MAG TPA: hypothetical protein VGF86_07625 [Candidatus Tumulicola sp.]|jgi:hypothetical protein